MALVSVPSVTVRGIGERAEQSMAGYVAEFEVLGPWSLETSRRFWEGFTPAALAAEPAGPGLRTVFCAEGDWRRAEADVTQAGNTARVMLAGDGDLDAAAAQVCRFLALDVDGRGWPEVGRRDPVIADAQARLPGLRPCGFHSPYEAAAWSVLAQRLRIVQAARLRAELIARHGEGGALPPPYTLVRLIRLDLDLPGRKGEYLRAVAEAALEGLLDGVALRALDPDDAVQRVQQVKGLGPFAAELVVVRGANAGWTPRSPSSTAPAAPSPKSRRRGGPTAPGPPSTCARCASIAPARSPAAEPSGPARCA
jgi:DNA-3-methyladenine glycosylase II